MAEDNGIRERLGMHGEAIANLKGAVEDLGSEIKDLAGEMRLEMAKTRTILDQAKGGWKAASIIGAVTGGIATAVLTYLGLGKH